MLGQAVNGPLAGKQLTPVVAVNHFWFSWPATLPRKGPSVAKGSNKAYSLPPPEAMHPAPLDAQLTLDGARAEASADLYCRKPGIALDNKKLCGLRFMKFPSFEEVP